MGNVNMEASQINYRGGEKKMSVEEALKNTSGEAAAIAQLQTDVLNLNSNKANQITIAPFFSAEASYEVGDLVYYNGLSYRCTNDHEGEWDADDFAATTIAGELDTLKSGLSDLINTINPAEEIVNVGAYEYTGHSPHVSKSGVNAIFYMNGFDGLSVGANNIGNLPNGFIPKNTSEQFTMDSNGNLYKVSLSKTGSISIYAYTSVSGEHSLIGLIPYICS